MASNRIFPACRADGTCYGMYSRLTPGYQECAARPGPKHVFTGVVSTDPSIMWREQNTAEMDAEAAAMAATEVTQSHIAEAMLRTFYDLLPNPKPSIDIVRATALSHLVDIRKNQ